MLKGTYIPQDKNKSCPADNREGTQSEGILSCVDVPLLQGRGRNVYTLARMRGDSLSATKGRDANMSVTKEYLILVPKTYLH